MVCVFHTVAAHWTRSPSRWMQSEKCFTRASTVLFKAKIEPARASPYGSLNNQTRCAFFGLLLLLLPATFLVVDPPPTPPPRPWNVKMLWYKKWTQRKKILEEKQEDYIRLCMKLSVLYLISHSHCIALHWARFILLYFREKAPSSLKVNNKCSFFSKFVVAMQQTRERERKKNKSNTPAAAALNKIKQSL